MKFSQPRWSHTATAPWSPCNGGLFSGLRGLACDGAVAGAKESFAKIRSAIEATVAAKQASGAVTLVVDHFVMENGVVHHEAA